MDGPVVKAARAALQTGELKPVLQWVKEPGEPEVRAAFGKTLVVRDLGPAARELADRYFFETVVRVHRAGEGAPYTGLKPAGTPLSPAVVAADQALETGSVDELVAAITKHVEAGLRGRFAEAIERRRHGDESVEAGRKWVEAYVEFVHYAEGVHEAAAGQGGHDGSGDHAH
jgi:hypothetical protein